jgi:hypothetical protein
MLDAVEPRVLQQAVAEIGTDRLVDRLGSRVAIGHQPLQLDKAGRLVQVVRDVDAGDGQESRHSLLREVLGPDARIARPLVAWSSGRQVDGSECQLVEPRSQAAIARDVAGGLARAHRDAEHGPDTGAHRPG